MASDAWNKKEAARKARLSVKKAKQSGQSVDRAKIIQTAVRDERNKNKKTSNDHKSPKISNRDLRKARQEAVRSGDRSAVRNIVGIKNAQQKGHFGTVDTLASRYNQNVFSRPGGHSGGTSNKLIDTLPQLKSGQRIAPPEPSYTPSQPSVLSVIHKMVQDKLSGADTSFRQEREKPLLQRVKEGAMNLIDPTHTLRGAANLGGMAYQNRENIYQGAKNSITPYEGVGIRETAREIPGTLLRGGIKTAQTVAPALSKFTETTGKVFGEGLAYATSPQVREQYGKGNLDILPTISKETVGSLGKKTAGAMIETSLYKMIPSTLKRDLITRGGIGYFQGWGFAVADGLANDRSLDEIMENGKSYAKYGAAGEILGPYIGKIISSGVGKGKFTETLKGLPKMAGEDIKRTAESTAGKFVKNRIGLTVEDVSKKESPLIQEARKYKSAEEFVANKGKFLRQMSSSEKFGIPDNYATYLDHGKVKGNAPKAVREGIAKQEEFINQVNSNEKLANIWKQANKSQPLQEGGKYKTYYHGSKTGDIKEMKFMPANPEQMTLADPSKTYGERGYVFLSDTKSGAEPYGKTQKIFVDKSSKILDPTKEKGFSFLKRALPNEDEQFLRNQVGDNGVDFALIDRVENPKSAKAIQSQLKKEGYDGIKVQEFDNNGNPDGGSLAIHNLEKVKTHYQSSPSLQEGGVNLSKADEFFKKAPTQEKVLPKIKSQVENLSNQIPSDSISSVKKITEPVAPRQTAEILPSRVSETGDIGVGKAVSTLERKSNKLPTQEVSYKQGKLGELWTSFRQTVQDNWVRVKKLQETKGVATEGVGPYGAKKLFSGRVGKRLEDVRSEVQAIDKDILQTSKKLKATNLGKDVDRYLIAKHAPERNAVHGVKASGMTNDEAKNILAEIKAKPHAQEVERIGSGIKKLNEKTLDILENGQIIDKETRDLLRTKYKEHIPLNRILNEDEDVFQALTSKGFQVKGTGLKRAVGSEKEVADIMTNVTANLDQAIIRSEKNRVNLATLKFARENKGLGIFEEIKPKAVGKTFDGNPILEKINDPLVLNIRENGKPVYLKIHDKQLASVFQGIGNEQMPAMLRMIGSYTKFKSGLATRFNPEFVFSNKIRDLQEMTVYMASQKEGGGFLGAAKTLGRDSSSMKAVTDSILGRKKGLLGKELKNVKLYEQMKLDGGTTGGMALSTRDAIELDINKIRQLNQSKPRQAARMILDGVDKWNTIFEDSTRLSVYKTALEKGASRDAAALLAKNATIDFNQKGTGGAIINALYMFSNASIQGTTKMLKSLRNPKVLAATVTTVGGATWAVNHWNDSVDENWRDKVSPLDRAKSLPIMIPTKDGVKYISIPTSWGLSPIKVIADEAYDMVNGKNKGGIMASAGKLFASAWDAYNPTGGTDFVSSITPTFADLPTDIARNKSYTGSAIRPDWKQGLPKADQFFKSLEKSNVGRTAIGATAALSEKTSRVFDLSPADVVYAYNDIIGGLGRFASKTISTIDSMKKGETPLPRDIPFVSRFLKTRTEEELQSSIKYKNTDKIMEGLRQFKTGSDEQKNAIQDAFSNMSTDDERNNLKYNLQEGGFDIKGIKISENTIEADKLYGEWKGLSDSDFTKKIEEFKKDKGDKETNIAQQVEKYRKNDVAKELGLQFEGDWTRPDLNINDKGNVVMQKMDTLSPDDKARFFAELVDRNVASDPLISELVKRKVVTGEQMLRENVSGGVKAKVLYEEYKTETKDFTENIDELWAREEPKIIEGLKTLNLSPREKQSQMDTIVQGFKDLREDDKARAENLTAQDERWSQMTVNDRADVLVEHFKDMDKPAAKDLWTQLDEKKLITPTLTEEFTYRWKKYTDENSKEISMSEEQKQNAYDEALALVKKREAGQATDRNFELSPEEEQKVQSALAMKPQNIDAPGQIITASTETGSNVIDIPGGSLASKNNNPGNLRFAGQEGASQGSGGFAKFDTPEAGYNALQRQIELDKSRDMTVQQFVSKYAPPKENNTALYIKQFNENLGSSADTKIASLDTGQISTFMALKESSTKIGNQIASRPPTLNTAQTNAIKEVASGKTTLADAKAKVVDAFEESVVAKTSAKKQETLTKVADELELVPPVVKYSNIGYIPPNKRYDVFSLYGLIAALKMLQTNSQTNTQLI